VPTPSLYTREKNPANVWRYKRGQRRSWRKDWPFGRFP
jgi:hypothetical protein